MREDTKRFLERQHVKLDGEIPDCQTCHWFHIDEGHCNQYAAAGLFGMCLKLKMERIER